ncbi:MAG: glycosyltransferase family 1 protein [Acidobacteriota bacterium]
MPHTIAIDARKIRDFGIGTYIRNLVRELGVIDRHNHYVLLVGPQGRDQLKNLPDNFDTIVEKAPVYSLRELWSVSRKLLSIRADLYHATHYVLPLLMPCRSVVTIHDIIHLLYPEFLPNRFAFYYAERMIGRSLGRADRVVTVSHNTKADLVDWFGVDGRKIEVVYNGIEDAFRGAPDNEAQQRWMDNLGLEPGYFLFVGNPKPHKNLDNVIKAYARALELHAIDRPLVCVGDRSGIEDRIRQRADQLGIADRIQLLGHVAQEALPAIYRGASLFLYPTLYEGFGLPVVEAMASGTPVITSNTSALKEIAAGYAHLVNPLDVEAMAKAIVQCASDSDHATSLATAGQRRANDFDWRKTAERTLEIYRLALGAPPRENVPRNDSGGAA